MLPLTPESSCRRGGGPRDDGDQGRERREERQGREEVARQQKRQTPPPTLQPEVVPQGDSAAPKPVDFCCSCFLNPLDLVPSSALWLEYVFTGKIK